MNGPTPATGQGSPRLVPLEPEALDPYARTIFDGVGVGGAANMVATMAHHPRLFARFLPVTIELGAGELPTTLRELVILRIAAVRRCRYVWDQHARMGLRAGLDERALDALGAGSADPGWGEPERTVLVAVDQLLESSTIDAPAWDALAGMYGPAELVELCVLVGHYSGLCFVANATGVALDHGGGLVPPLPDLVGGHAGD